MVVVPERLRDSGAVVHRQVTEEEVLQRDSVAEREVAQRALGEGQQQDLVAERREVVRASSNLGVGLPLAAAELMDRSRVRILSLVIERSVLSTAHRMLIL